MNAKDMEPGPLYLVTRNTKKKKKKSQSQKKSTKTRKVDVEVSSAGVEVEDEDYLVEHVLDKKFVKGVPYYLIKWIGWPHSANTWEPVEHLDRCMWLVKQYEDDLVDTEARAKQVPPPAPAIKIKVELENVEDTIVSESSISPCDIKPIISLLNAVPMPENNTEETQGHYKLKLKTGTAVEENTYGSDEDLSEVDVNSGLLRNCPSGKRLEKIHAVTPINGYLHFLLQWKSVESRKRAIPALSPKNSNIVRASSVNKKFPRQVIRFYEERISFSRSLDTANEESKKAKVAVQLSKEHSQGVLREKQKKDEESDDDDVDSVSEAIENARRKRDMFNIDESDLSTSSNEDSILFKSDDDDDED